MIKYKESRRAEYKECESIRIMIDGKRYKLSERFGELEIHSSDGHLLIHPICANEISVVSKE